MHGLLTYNIDVGVRARARSVSLTIETRVGNGARKCQWRHTPEARGGLWEIWKSQLVELRTGHRTRRVDFRGSQRLDEFARYGRCTRCGGRRWKSQNRKNVYLSPYVEEPLNSKVIKGFVLELRSHYVFFEFRDSYVLCIYVMNVICTFHIFMYGYVTVLSYLSIPPLGQYMTQGQFLSGV